MLNQDQIEALKAPLDPKHIREPSGSFGPKGSYIEGWHAINELNRVFGFDGWSYTINLTRDALEKGKDSRGNEQWQAAYTCVCTLQAAGVTRQDVGFGSGFSKQVGDAVEGATKEAATDALKRCARTFGNIFGLALYDKSRENVSAPVVNDGHLQSIRETARKAQVAETAICKNMKIEKLEQLPISDYQFVIDKLNITLAEKEAA